MKIPSELAAYFEHCFVYGAGFCEGCGEGVPFVSDHERYTDESWLEESKTMKAQGWVIPSQQVAFCSSCAKNRNFAHDPNAHEISPNENF
jgi:hypothetical protein